MLSGKRVAVIGAGIAGCLVARGLAEKGASLDVFDKSRGTGGRLAAARLGETAADLGATLLEDGAVARLKQADRRLPLELWHHRRAGLNLRQPVEARAWVATPRASALTRSLLDGIPLHAETRIAEVNVGEDDLLWLKNEVGQLEGAFDHVVLAVPAPQAVPLLASWPELQCRAEAVQMTPAWVLLVELDARPDSLADIDLLQGEHAVLGRVCRDSSKPGRSGEVWQITANSDWSAQHVDADPNRVAVQLLEAFRDLAGNEWQVQHQRVHRWLYAEVSSAPAVKPLSHCGRVSVCGDWVCGQGVSAAMESVEHLIRALEDSDRALLD